MKYQVTVTDTVNTTKTIGEFTLEETANAVAAQLLLTGTVEKVQVQLEGTGV